MFSSSSLSWTVSAYSSRTRKICTHDKDCAVCHVHICMKMKRKVKNRYYEKTCEYCHVLYVGRTHHQRWCKPECYKRYRRTSTYRWQGRKTKYGITPEDYDRMLDDQNNVCKICQQPETKVRRGKKMNLSIDHDHVSGKIRGLLCSNCNRGLGMFKDNQVSLRAAAEYLR